MKSARVLATGVLFLACIVLAAAENGVYAQQSGIINCSDGIEFSTTENCDLAIQKEVSINGGAFVDANTAGEAAQGTVGDNIVYRISVTNPSVPDDGFFPAGTFIVGDNFPTGATFVDADPSIGGYDQVNHQWTFSLGNATVYPVVMTIDATANTTGLVQNIAFLSGYECDGDFFCEYSDANNENDADQAWAEFSGAPVVLGESATATPQVLGLADTGSAVTQSIVAGLIIGLTLGVALIGRFKLSPTKADQ